MSYPAAGAGLGFLLDSAVKTAVTHLATSQPQQQQQQQHEFPPEYDYRNNLSPSFYDYPEYPQYNNIQEYHHDEEYHHQHQSQAPAGWTQHHRVVSPGHHSTRRVTTAAERQDGVLTGLTRFLPMIMALPVMAAASYYLVVLNGPTPVVKERSHDEFSVILDIVSRLFNQLSDHSE